MAESEILLGFTSDNPRLGKSRRILVGCDVRTNGLPGVTLGLSDTAELKCVDVLPKAYEAKTGGFSFAWPFGLCWHHSDGSVQRLGWIYHSTSSGQRPSFHHRISLGVDLCLSEHLLSIGGGYQNLSLLAVPKDDSAIYSLRYSSHDLGNSIFLRNRTETGIHEVK